MFKSVVRVLAVLLVGTVLVVLGGARSASAHEAASPPSAIHQATANVTAMAVRAPVDNALCKSAGDAQNVVDFLKSQGIKLQGQDASNVLFVLQYAANACGCITDLKSFDVFDAWSDCGGVAQTLIFLIQQFITNPTQVS